MYLKTEQNNVFPTTQDVLKVIEKLNNAEISRDTELFEKIIKPYWKNLDDELKLPEHIEITLKAEIYKLCGFFLSYIGYTRGIDKEKKYQERGKKLIWESIMIYKSLDMNDKAATGRIMLSVSYYSEGNIADAELILTETELDYQDNPLSPIALACNCNRLLCLFFQNKHKQAEELLETMAIPMSFCDDDRLLLRFHNQAGILYLFKEDYGLAYTHQKESIKYAKRLKHYRFIGINYANHAYLLLKTGKLDLAHKYADLAHKMFVKVKATGWIAIVEDTRAQIFIEQNNLPEAESAITKSIDIIRFSENNKDICDTLATRAKIYLATNRMGLALIDISEIIITYKQKTGVYSETYIEEFTKILFPVTNSNFEENVKKFKHFLIKNILQNNGNDLRKTAEKLGLRQSQLGKIIKQDFPDLYIKPTSKNKLNKGTNSSRGKTKDGHISICNPNGPELRFNCQVPAETPEIFYCDVPDMEQLCGVSAECLVAVFEGSDFGSGSHVLAYNGERYFFSIVNYNDDIDLTVFYNGDSYKINEVTIVGEPLAFAPFLDSGDLQVIEFSKNRVLKFMKKRREDLKLSVESKSSPLPPTNIEEFYACLKTLNLTGEFTFDVEELEKLNPEELQKLLSDINDFELFGLASFSIDDKTSGNYIN